MKNSSLRELFNSHSGKYIAKIDHFFDAYEKHFLSFQGKNIRLLEIGVDQGGSLELWGNYFGSQCELHGIDINPDAIEKAPKHSTIHLGSQGDISFLKSIAKNYGPFDIVIDDGSHLMNHQTASFETIYPLMHSEGIYICEDAFTSYWHEYGGGLKKENTFMEYAKDLIDKLHAYWATDDDLHVSPFTLTTRGIYFYSGTVVFERGKVAKPIYAAKHQGGYSEISIADLKKAAATNMK